MLLRGGRAKGQKLSTANEQLERGEFFDASKTYRKVYNKLTKREDRPLRGEVAYKLGTYYRRLNPGPAGSRRIPNAIRYEYPDSMTYYWLGRSLQADGQYAQALDAYTAFLRLCPDDELAKEGARGCRVAIQAKKAKKSRYVVKNAKIFNSRRADFAPMYLDKNFDQLFFTSTNEKSVRANTSPKSQA